MKVFDLVRTTSKRNCLILHPLKKHVSASGTLSCCFPGPKNTSPQVLEQREVQRVKACKNVEKVPIPTVNNGESFGESGGKKPDLFRCLLGVLREK